MSELICYCNGGFRSLNEASISVNDLGYQRGYGIFDFLRVSGDTALYIDDHLDRFFQSAAEMRLPLQHDKESLKQVVAELITKNKLPHSGIRIMLSGGASADGYQISDPRLVLLQSALTPPPDQLPSPYKVVCYPHQRQMPHVKTTDYLMAIWLQPWVKEQGADDVLYHNNGSIGEFPRSNFFMVMEDDTVVTPARNILKGITRKQLFQIAAEKGIRMEERDISLDEIGSAKEAFISSSTKRIIPIKQVDAHHFPETPTMSARLFAFLKEREQALVES